MVLSCPSCATCPFTDFMQPQLYTSENIQSLPFPPTEDGNYACRYLLPLMTEDPQKYIRNVYNTRLMAVKVDETVLPVTVTDFHPQNTYTVSPYSHYVSYGGLEEVRRLGNPLAEALVKLAMKPVARYFRRAGLDRVVFVNNYLLSTNLYPSVSGDRLPALSEALIRWFPDRAIVFRSVDRKKNPHVARALEGLGYDLVLSRQVWYMDPAASLKTRQCREDMRVLKRNGYEVVDGGELSDDDLRRALHLYGMLYLQKYSYFNPQFTFDFLKLARDRDLLHMYGLKKDGRLNGIMGFFVRNGAMTQPLFGYDASLPAEEGLYRLLTLVTLREGVKRGLLVHASGGVGKFKKARGGESVTEYNAVYARHLPRRRQLPWKLIKAVSKAAIPYFKKMDF